MFQSSWVVQWLPYHNIDYSTEGESVLSKEIECAWYFHARILGYHLYVVVLKNVSVWILKYNSHRTWKCNTQEIWEEEKNKVNTKVSELFLKCIFKIYIAKTYSFPSFYLPWQKLKQEWNQGMDYWGYNLPMTTRQLSILLFIISHDKKLLMILFYYNAKTEIAELTVFSFIGE